MSPTATKKKGSPDRHVSQQAPVRSNPAVVSPPFEFEAYSLVPKGNLWSIRTITVAGDRITKCEDTVEDLRVIQAAKLSQILGVSGGIR